MRALWLLLIAGVGAAEPCDGWAPAGATCTPMGGCCAPGLFCADPEGTGQGVCRRGCSRSQPCAAHEVCLPLIVGLYDVEWGECRGDRCVPGREAEVCGHPATCVVVGQASLCGPAGERGFGEACSDSLGAGPTCRPGLLCVAGQCAQPCQPEAPCPSGAQCLSLDLPEKPNHFKQLQEPLPFGYCEDGCDPVAGTGCAPGQSCRAEAVVDADRRLIGRCADGPAGLPPEAPCTPDGPSCGGSSLCVDIGDGTHRCTRMCASASGHGCPPRAVCHAARAGFGFCVGRCDPLTGAGCPPAHICSALQAFGARSEGGIGLAGQCVPPANRRSADEPCQQTLTGGSDCGPHLVCRNPGRQPTCQRLCGPGAPPCPGGQTCRAVPELGSGFCEATP